MSLLPALGRCTRLIALVPLAVLLLTACANEEVVVVRTTITPGQTSGAADGGVTQPSSNAPSTVGSAGQSTSAGPGLAAAIRVIANPEFGSKNIGPNDPISVTVFSGTISAMKLEASDGTPVAGEVSADKTTFTVKDRLAYGLSYTFTGTAAAPDGTTRKISGKVSTANPASTVRAAVQIPEGKMVGVGAPVVVSFCPAIKDKAAAQKALSITTDKKDIEGSWGWMADEDFSGDGVCSRAHYRTKAYWPANTQVKLTANLAGVNYGNGWGREDIVRKFTVGRSLIMKADVATMRLVVMKDGAVFRNYKVSYGQESVPGRTTVSGIHIVQEKYPTFKMCNPTYGYCNLLEKWAIRINNNGEFIHENEKVEKAGLLGVQNVSHGCINMGGVDAKELYDMAVFGDPVEVSGTSQQMSPKDYVYDWSYSWDQWQTLSAL